MAFDINKPVENPALSELLRKRAECIEAKDQPGYSEVMGQISEELCMRSRLLALVQFSDRPTNNGDGTATFEKGTTVGFVLLSESNGAAWQPVFTDWEELFKWPHLKEEETPPQTLILDFDQLSGMLGASENVMGFVVNPFTDNLLVPREIIASWAKTKEQILSAPKTETHIVKGGIDILKKDTKVRIGDPAEYPQELVDALTECALADGSITRLWLRQVQFEGREPEYLVAAEAEKEEQALFDAIGAAARGHLGGMTVVVVGASSELGRKSSEDCEPFFSR